VLKGRGPGDVRSIVLHVATKMVLLAGLEPEPPAARRRAETALASGKGLQTFARMVELQGGNPRVVDDDSLFPSVNECVIYKAPRPGVITAIRAEAIGRASHALGAGRSKVGEAVDHAVGIILRAKPADRVAAGDPLFELHHRNGRGLEAAHTLCAAAITIGDEAAPRHEPILDEVR
jgi:thymidine phosphorylase